jgi:hypothetical protein
LPPKKGPEVGKKDIDLKFPARSGSSPPPIRRIDIFMF